MGLIKEKADLYIKGHKRFIPEHKDEIHRFALVLDNDVREALRSLANNSGISLEEAIRQIAKEICDDLDDH